MVRRVVATVSPSGKSVITHDGDLKNVIYQHTPGFAHALVWASGARVSERDGEQPASFSPAPGETVGLTVTFPPDSVFGSADFDPAAAVAENLQNTPGLAELFEADAPGMHTTPSVDYAVVLDGTVVLELDDGESVTLGVGDIVVQNGNRHAWRVPSDKPATIFVVLVGQTH